MARLGIDKKSSKRRQRTASQRQKAAERTGTDVKGRPAIPEKWWTSWRTKADVDQKLSASVPSAMPARDFLSDLTIKRPQPGPSRLFKKSDGAGRFILAHPDGRRVCHPALEGCVHAGRESALSDDPTQRPAKRATYFWRGFFCVEQGIQVLIITPATK